MPDVQEVFRMATQKVRPDPGALERQRRKQRWRLGKERVAVYALVAGLVIAGLVVGISTLGGRDARPADRPDDGGPAAVEITEPGELPEPTTDLSQAIDRLTEDVVGNPNVEHRADVRGVDGIRLDAKGQGGPGARAWWEPAILVGEPGQTLTIELSNRDVGGEQPHTFTVPALGIDVDLPAGQQRGPTVQVTFPEDGQQIVFLCRIHELYGQVGAFVASG